MLAFLFARYQHLLVDGLLKQAGIVLRGKDALYRLSRIDTVAFGKTGLLTKGEYKIANPGALSAQQYQLAASLARNSDHPAARAVLGRYRGPLIDLPAIEKQGCGLEARADGRTLRLGSRAWCGGTDADAHMTEIWFSGAGEKPARFLLEDTLRPDANAGVAAFLKEKISPLLLSGDRPGVVAHIAEETGIPLSSAGLDPDGKAARLGELKSRGRRVLLIADSVADAALIPFAYLTIAHDAAPRGLLDKTDILCAGSGLQPVAAVARLARKSRALAMQNLALVCGGVIGAAALVFLGRAAFAALPVACMMILVFANGLRIKARAC
jgi:Cu2+-exporting ATPase